MLTSILRVNPCSLGWYLPLLVQDKDVPDALLQPSDFFGRKFFRILIMNISDHSLIGEANGEQLNSNKLNNARKSGKTVEPGLDKTSQMRGIGRTPSSMISAGGPGTSQPPECTAIGHENSNVRTVSQVDVKKKGCGAEYSSTFLFLGKAEHKET